MEIPKIGILMQRKTRGLRKRVKEGLGDQEQGQESGYGDTKDTDIDAVEDEGPDEGEGRVADQELRTGKWIQYRRQRY